MTMETYRERKQYLCVFLLLLLLVSKEPNRLRCVKNKIENEIKANETHRKLQQQKQEQQQ